jgi:glycosyltransferase involved in cell wall biosynthesis
MKHLEEKILNLQRDFENQRNWMSKIKSELDEIIEKLSVNFDRLASFNNYKIANNNIKFVGYLNQNELIKFTQKAKWFVLAANEDFGITSIESQSCLTPVIALEKGGYLETVVNNKTGVFFSEQNYSSLKNAISSNQFKVFNKTDFEANVSKFSKDKFHKDLKVIIDRYVKNR